MDKDRWLFEVLSPVNGEVIWSCSSTRSRDVHKKWFKETGNKFLSKGKVNRACIGELHCPFIRCYKINKYAEKERKKKMDQSPESPSTPTPSEYPDSDTSLDDYSTTGETTDFISDSESE